MGYHRALFYRENCYNCKYAQKKRVGDLTISDFTGLGKGDVYGGPYNSISCVIVSSEEGKLLFDCLQNSGKVIAFERPLTEALDFEKQLNHPSIPHRNRNIFVDTYRKNKDFEMSAKKSLIKEIFLYKSGIRFIKSILRNILRWRKVYGRKNKEKRLLKNTALYAASNFGSKILTFLIVPLYTYYLTTAEYGTADTMISIVNVLAPISVLSIHEALLRWLLKSDEDDKTVIWTGLKIYLSLALTFDLVLACVLLITRYVYCVDMILLLTTLSFQTVMQYIVRGLKMNKCFAFSGVIYTFWMLLLSIILIVLLKQGTVGMIRSMSIAHFMSGTYIFLNIKSFLVDGFSIFNKKLAKSMLHYSCMLVPNAISWWIMNTSDRVMLTIMMGSAFTGIYSVACKFPSIMTTIHTLFYQAWQEQAVLEYGSDSRDAYYTKIFNAYMRLSICIILVLIPSTKLFINLFMSESYKTSYQYVSILYLGSLFSSFSSFYGTGYISAKDSKNATITTTIGALINCIINLVFIKFIGIWAACLSTLVAYFAVYIIRVYQTRKYFRIDLNRKVFFVLLSIAIAYSAIVIVANNIFLIFMTIIAIIIMIYFNKGVINVGKNMVLKKLRK